MLNPHDQINHHILLQKNYKPPSWYRRSLLGVLGLPQLLPMEVLVVDTLGQLDGADVQAGLGGDHVVLVDATQGAAVEVVGAGHQQQTGGQLLEEDHTLERRRWRVSGNFMRKVMYNLVRINIK